MATLLFPVEVFYLIFFTIDESVAVVRGKSLIEQKLNVGNDCHVKEGKKVYDGRVIARGKHNNVLYIYIYIVLIIIIIIKK